MYRSSLSVFIESNIQSQIYNTQTYKHIAFIKKERISVVLSWHWAGGDAENQVDVEAREGGESR